MNKDDLIKLIDKYQKNLCTEEEQKLVENYLNSFQHKSTWDESIHGDKEVLEKKIFNRIQKEIHPKSVRSLSVYTRVLSIAASMVILLTIGVGIWLSNYPSPSDQIVYETKRTLPGQKLTISLGDGSSIKLNAGSTLTYPETFEDGIRKVKLAGEAFFEIAEDTQKPFIVETENLQTVVLGTSFNINTRDSISVTVATGRVKVQAIVQNEAPQLLSVLTPRQQLIYNKTSHAFRQKQVDLFKALAWKDNMLIFESQPLAKVIPQLEVWYGVNFEVANKDLLSCRFTGDFHDEPLQSILETMAIAANIEYQMQGKKVVLYGKGCNPM